MLTSVGKIRLLTMRSRGEKAGVEGILMWMLASPRMITEIMGVITKDRERDKSVLTVAKDDSQRYSEMGRAINSPGFSGRRNRKRDFFFLSSN